MKTFVFAFFLLHFVFDAFAQAVEASTIHIARPKNFNGSAVKMKLDVNGRSVILPRNSYIELPVTNEINIRTTTKRLAKFSTPLKSTVQQAKYFIAYFSVLNVKGWPKDIVVIQPVCKECYDERIIGCTAVSQQKK